MFRFLLLVLVLLSFSCSENPVSSKDEIEPLDLILTELEISLDVQNKCLIFIGKIQNNSEITLSEIEISIRLYYDESSYYSNREFSNPSILPRGYLGSFFVVVSYSGNYSAIKSMELELSSKEGIGIKQNTDFNWL